jgi:tetratricopeptide (TPR) repeat protein
LRKDYLLYQNRNEEAIRLYQTILKNYTGQEIEAGPLLGKIYEKKGDFALALSSIRQLLKTQRWYLHR